ncbi:MAG: response regulator transcription factor [Acidimicrobiales bacterium]
MTVDRVLVASADRRLAEWLLQTVLTAGWGGGAASSADGALAAVEEVGAGLVLVDVTSLRTTEPWIDQVHRSGARVIAVSTRRAEGELESSLAAGADAFVQCPVGSHELVARLRAVARRPAPPRSTGAAAVVEAGDLVLRGEERKVRVPGGELDLARRELAVLERLASVAPLVVHRDDLARALWSMEPDAPLLDPVVRRLRARLEALDGWRRIETVRGVGFRLLIAPPAQRWSGSPGSRDGRPTFTLSSSPGNGSFGATREPSGL